MAGAGGASRQCQAYAGTQLREGSSPKGTQSAGVLNVRTWFVSKRSAKGAFPSFCRDLLDASHASSFTQYTISATDCRVWPMLQEREQAARRKRAFQSLDEEDGKPKEARPAAAAQPKQARVPAAPKHSGPPRSMIMLKFNSVRAPTRTFSVTTHALSTCACP